MPPTSHSRRPRHHDGHEGPRFLPLPPDVSLGEPVFENNFYQRLEERLDLPPSSTPRGTWTKLLIAAVESELAQKHEDNMAAESTEARLLTLRKNLAEVEADTEEAFESRRELVKLLVQKVTVSPNEEGRPRIEVTYRFGPPTGDGSVAGGRNSEEFRQARSKGRGGDLLSGRPQIGSYDVAVDRAPGTG